ncbi:MAG: hypothetical protein IJ446_09420 [Oscillospiraceae bacterium]|nr:hypothetical protein [Oscillospiraceae bacterium]
MNINSVNTNIGAYNTYAANNNNTAAKEAEKQGAVNNTNTDTFTSSVSKTEGVAVSSGLSAGAQAILDELREKYDNVGFKVEDFDTDEEAQNVLNNMSTGKEYNCVITSDLLEQMAASEEKKESIMQSISASIGDLDVAYEELGEENPFTSLGISYGAEGLPTYFGTVSFAEEGEEVTPENSVTIKAKSVEELLSKLKERQAEIDELAAKRAEAKRLAEKEAEEAAAEKTEEEKAAEKAAEEKSAEEAAVQQDNAADNIASKFITDTTVQEAAVFSSMA